MLFHVVHHNNLLPPNLIQDGEHMEQALSHIREALQNFQQKGLQTQTCSVASPAQFDHQRCVRRLYDAVELDLILMTVDIDMLRNFTVWVNCNKWKITQFP